MEDRKCLWCGSGFSAYPSVPRKYCSRACATGHKSDAARRKRERACLVCGVVFVPKHSKSPGLYCSHECRGLADRKERVERNGYWCVRKPEHPRAGIQGYVGEHTLVMEKHIGRLLCPGEVVHHINHDKKDNRLANLELMKESEHKAMHLRELMQEGRINSDDQRRRSSERAIDRNRATEYIRGRDGRFIRKLQQE